MIYLVYAGWPTLVNAILLDVIDPVDGRIPKTKKCLISSIKLAFFSFDASKSGNARVVASYDLFIVSKKTLHFDQNNS